MQSKVRLLIAIAVPIVSSLLPILLSIYSSSRPIRQQSAAEAVHDEARKLIRELEQQLIRELEQPRAEAEEEEPRKLRDVTYRKRHDNTISQQGQSRSDMEIHTRQLQKLGKLGRSLTPCVPYRRSIQDMKDAVNEAEAVRERVVSNLLLLLPQDDQLRRPKNFLQTERKGTNTQEISTVSKNTHIVSRRACVDYRISLSEMHNALRDVDTTKERVIGDPLRIVKKGG